MSSQLVDLHCHILPGIDDGAKNLDVSMSSIQKEMEDGVVGIVFTPHFHYERITLDAFVQQRKMAYRSVVAQLAERKLPLAVKLGAEVYFTTALASLDLSKLASAGSRYILIEFPTSIHPGGIEDTLFAVQNRGYTPILAHVERYPYVTEDPTLLYRWVSSGALAQINASGLVRSGHTAKWLHKLLDWNLVHLMCSDCHSVTTRPPNLKDGMAQISSSTAKLLQKNAIDVYLNKEISIKEPIEPKFRFGRWV